MWGRNSVFFTVVGTFGSLSRCRTWLSQKGQAGPYCMGAGLVSTVGIRGMWVFLHSNVRRNSIECSFRAVCRGKKADILTALMLSSINFNIVLIYDNLKTCWIAHILTHPFDSTKKITFIYFSIDDVTIDEFHSTLNSFKIIITWWKHLNNNRLYGNKQQ